MQEQNEQTRETWTRWINKKHLIPAGVCAILLLSLAVSLMVIYRDLPSAHWREIQTDFPWEGSGICVSKVKCHWQNSKGDERMELRAAFYPAAIISLSEKATGQGHLIVRFLDDSGTPSGQTIYLPYKDGAFLFKEEPNILAMGKESTIHSEVGFRTKEEFYNHALAEDRPLWKVSIWNRTDQAEGDEFLGSVTIPATDKAK